MEKMKWCKTHNLKLVLGPSKGINAKYFLQVDTDVEKTHTKNTSAYIQLDSAIFIKKGYPNRLVHTEAIDQVHVRKLRPAFPWSKLKTPGITVRWGDSVQNKVSVLIQ